LIYLYLSKI